MLQGSSAKFSCAQQGWCRIHQLQSWHFSQVPTPSALHRITAPVLPGQREHSDLPDFLPHSSRSPKQRASLSITSNCYSRQTW